MIDYRALATWAITGETGSSSKFMANFLAEMPRDKWAAHPSDGGDFERCVGLLNAVPSLRALLPKMADASPYWAALVKNWDRIEAISIEARYDAMKAILDPIQNTDQNRIGLGKNASIILGGYKAKA